MADYIPSTPSSPDGGATANELLREVRLFVSGATNSSSNSDINPNDVVKSAIFLLKSLPAAREAVLEHLYSVFDEFVGTYVNKLEGETESKPSSISGTVYLLDEINSILTNFIISNPESWAPIIFNWSLDLLGRLSSKYGDRRGLQSKSVSINSSDSLNNILEVWMKCQATKMLIHLSTQCLSTLMNSNVDVCIDALLDMSVQHSPYFDWFIAHIGSCFPNTIITRVLACGLKDFCSVSSKHNMTEKKVPKIASVVEILGHLSAQHSKQIKQALLSLAKDGICANQLSRTQLAILPFLLQLASMSPVLLCSHMSDIISICLNKEALNKLPSIATQWKNMGIVQNSENMINMVVKLIMQSGDNGSRLLSFLLDMAVFQDDYPQQVKETCSNILDVLLIELQMLVYTNTMDIPVISSVTSDLSFVTKHVTSSQVSAKSKWLCQLLACFCLFCGETISMQVITVILRKCPELNILINILRYLDQQHSDVLTSSIANALRNVNQENLHQLFKNLANLIRYEKAKPQINDALGPSLNFISGQLNNTDASISFAALRLLALVPLTENPDVAATSKLCYEIVTLLFSKLTTENRDKAEMEYTVNQCKKLLSTLSCDPSLLFLILRLLVQGSFSEDNWKWFGNNKQKPAVKAKKSFSLLDENRKHSRRIPLPQSHSTVFYTGVIGNGIRIMEKQDTLNNVIISENKHYLLHIIRCCCIPKGADAPGIDAMSKLSLLLVELISPDVMFNGLPWPDEDFLKVTMERDIFINKLLEENPILWDILFLVGKTKPALCYCSVILRGVAATLLSFWSSCQEKSTTNCPKVLLTSRKLISLMSLGELIPPPLSQMGDVLPELTPYEAFVVLNDLWKYMCDNVPSPDTFIKNEHGEMVRNTTASRAPEKYTVHLRHIMQTKVHKLGSMYPRMFPG